MNGSSCTSGGKGVIHPQPWSDDKAEQARDRFATAWLGANDLARESVARVLFAHLLRTGPYGRVMALDELSTLERANGRMKELRVAEAVTDA